MNHKKNWITSAHRGFVDGALKENCLAAYYNAFLRGAEMIETDARLSSDGVLIVITMILSEALMIRANLFRML
jgi:glycerophosphoryl diester phosphodiesterase